MFNSLNFMAIIVAAGLAPAVIHAQSADRIGNLPHHWAVRQTANDPSSRAGARSARLAAAIFERRTVPSSPYVYAASPWPEGRPLRAIDHAFAPQGVIGSVGYMRIVDDHQIAPDAGLAASLGFSRPDSLVGAGVYYEFR